MLASAAFTSLIISDDTPAAGTTREAGDLLLQSSFPTTAPTTNGITMPSTSPISKLSDEDELDSVEDDFVEAGAVEEDSVEEDFVEDGCVEVGCVEEDSAGELACGGGVGDGVGDEGGVCDGVAGGDGQVVTVADQVYLTAHDTNRFWHPMVTSMPHFTLIKNEFTTKELPPSKQLEVLEIEREESPETAEPSVSSELHGATFVAIEIREPSVVQTAKFITATQDPAT
jgi:hypothetical protein